MVAILREAVRTLVAEAAKKSKISEKTIHARRKDFGQREARCRRVPSNAGLGRRFYATSFGRCAFLAATMSSVRAAPEGARRP
jgi:hypothetical protein